MGRYDEEKPNWRQWRSKKKKRSVKTRPRGKSATRANPNSPTHVRTIFADPCFAEPEDLTISHMHSGTDREKYSAAEPCLYVSLSLCLSLCEDLESERE
jgi:hypothetical protein